jgi:hypothetical protein
MIFLKHSCVLVIDLPTDIQTNKQYTNKQFTKIDEQVHRPTYKRNDIIALVANYSTLPLGTSNPVFGARVLT